MVSRPFQSFLKRLNAPRERRRRMLRTGRRITRPPNVLQQWGDCACVVEPLENRWLLAATTLPAPSFILKGPAPAPVAPSSATPASQPGIVAPIVPAQMQAAYGVNLISFGGIPGTGQGQTIAIVDAYQNPDLVGDAMGFSTQFNLPQFNVSGGPTLQVLNQNGGTSLAGVPYPVFRATWDLEESVDVQWAHAIAPEANIILFEANSNSWSDLLTAERTAANTPGVSVVSNSWGTPEFSGEQSDDSYFTTPAGHQGVTFIASSGDGGINPQYPGSSPNVISVGGTTLDISTSGTYLGESAWFATGGGFSAYESQPGYQAGTAYGISSTARTVPDVAVDGDPKTGVYAYDTWVSPSFWQCGGTSIGAPIVAGLIAIANQGRALNGLPTLDGPSQTLPMLYDMSRANFHDIVTGNNGYAASPGYDLATGLGSPIANDVVAVLSGQTGHPPTVTAPISIPALPPNTSYTFPAGSIGVTDAAASGTSDSLTLSAIDGALTLGSTAGLTFSFGSNGSSAMTVMGTLANLNAALSGLVYAPPVGFGGPDVLTVADLDQADGLTGSASIALTVNAPPSISAPAAANVNENASYTFTGSSITLADAAASGTSDSLALAVSDGRLILSSTTGLTFASGYDGSSSMAVIGTLADLNTALNGLKYVPNSGYTGGDSLHFAIDNSLDNLTGSAAVSITVIASLAPPTVIGPSAVAVHYNGYYQFATNYGFLLADSSAASDTITLAVSHGTLTFLSTNGLTFLNGTSNGSSSMTVTGTLSDMNAAIVGGLDYTPTKGYLGSDTLQAVLLNPSDGLHGEDDVALTISATQGPIILGPWVYTLNENSSYETFGIYVIVTDPSANGTSDSVTVSVGNGKLELASVSGVTITSGSNGSSSMTINGTLGNLIGALKFLAYEPNPGFSGSDHFWMSINDSGDDLSGSSIGTFWVFAPPSVTAPAKASVAENSSYTFSGAISVADSDTGGADTVVLSATEGTITLGSTQGLLFFSGSNGSSSMTFQATAFTYLNDALSSVTYTPNAGYSGPDSLQISIDDYGDYQSASAAVAITVAAPPVISVPAPIYVGENGGVTFGTSSFVVTDAAAVGTSDSLTLSALHGTINLPTTTGLTFSSGANNSSSMTVNGTLASLNAALGSGLIYTPTANYLGPDALQFSVSDSLDNLTGSASLSMTIVVPPSVSAPKTGTTVAGSPLIFAAGAITLTDIHASGSSDSLLLNAKHGTITLGSTSGLTFSYGSNGTSGMVVVGTLATLNAAVSGLTYTANAAYAGPDPLTLALINSSLNIAGGVVDNLTVTPAGPSITAPGSESVAAGTTLVFPGWISVTDFAATSTSDVLSLTVAHGTLTLGTTNGITFTAGSNNSASMAVSGTLANLNAAINGLVYLPTSGYTGADSLQLSLVDNGDSLSGSATVPITVNGPPIITAPATASVNVNSSLTFSGSISLTDASASGTSDSLTIAVAHGALTLATSTGLTFTAGSNGTASFTVTGALANLNSALNGLTYQPMAGYLGSDSLAVSATDSGDGLSASKTVALTINAPTPPTISAPGSSSVAVNGSLVFSSANSNAITVADTGPGSGSDSLTLTVTHGTVTLSTTSGLTIGAGANGSATITVTGSVANLNAALAGLTYKPTSGYSGSDVLTISLNDSVDNLSASASVALTVSTAPTITAPATATVAVTSTLTFSSANKNAVSIADGGAGGAVEPLTLTATDGTLSLASTNGITFTSGINNSASMTIKGTLANLNTALSGLTFTPAKIGTATVVLSYTDVGDGLMASATINITVGKGITKLGGGSPVNSPSSVSGPTGGGTVTPAASPTMANGSTDSAMPPDALTQWQGLAAAVDVLTG
ncbi:MAG TPA: hypothetical protein VGP76_14785 [Planctomycetaceae bacterium]|nr:hypothetical protein [Planctomycetaceae bacterium]